jgi:hypothetical protein
VVICPAVFLTRGIFVVHGESSQDATTAIADANHALQVSFAAVANAESAGVNVSGLLSGLNEARANLAMGEAAMDSGNYSEAINQANACTEIAENVSEEAVVLKNEAPGWLSSFLSAYAIELLGGSVFFVVLLLTWVWFK